MNDTARSRYLNKLARWTTGIIISLIFVPFLGFYSGTQFTTFSPLMTILMLGLVFALAIPGLNFTAIKFNLLDYTLMILLCWFLITAILSEIPYLAIKRWVLIAGSGLMFYIIGRLAQDPTESINKQSYALVTILILSGIFALGVFLLGAKIEIFQPGEIRYFVRYDTLGQYFDLGIGQAYAGRRIENWFLFRPTGLFSNPNGFAIFTMIGLIIVHLTIKNRIIRILLMCISLALICWTFSRAVIIASCIAYIFIYSSGKRRRISLQFASIILVPVSILLFYCVIFIFGSVGGTEAETEFLRFANRGNVWNEAITLAIQSNLWTGSGFGISQEVHTGLSDSVFSIWITLLLETGIIGVMLATTLVVGTLSVLSSAILRTTDKSIRSCLLTIAGLVVAITIHQCFDLGIFRFHPLHMLFFLLVGLSANPELITQHATKQ